MGNPPWSKESSKTAPATRPAVARCSATRRATCSAALKCLLGSFPAGGLEALATRTFSGAGFGLYDPAGDEIFGGGGLGLVDGALGIRPEEVVGAAPRAAGITRVPEVTGFGRSGGAPGKNNEKADWSVGNFPSLLAEEKRK